MLRLCTRRAARVATAMPRPVPTRRLAQVIKEEEEDFFSFTFGRNSIFSKYPREGCAVGALFGAYLGLSEAQKDYEEFVKSQADKRFARRGNKYDAVAHTMNICYTTAAGAFGGLFWPVTAPVAALYFFLDQANRE